MSIAPANDLVDEAAVAVEVFEVAAAAEQKRVLERSLQMAMGAFDRPVLMSDTGIVARRRHPIVTHEVLVTLGQVVLC
jgi:hypothetical protein